MSSVSSAASTLQKLLQFPKCVPSLAGTFDTRLCLVIFSVIPTTPQRPLPQWCRPLNYNTNVSVIIPERNTTSPSPLRNRRPTYIEQARTFHILPTPPEALPHTYRHHPGNSPSLDVTRVTCNFAGTHPLLRASRHANN